MQISELDQYRLSDAVRFHDQLNPRIWDQDEHLQSPVREALLKIADDFQEFLGVPDLDLEDITISGSNAAYSYTPRSDIDLHLVVRMPDDPIYQELFAAKKYQYNDQHNIRIGGADVELYVQPVGQAHVSQGIYSIKNNRWIRVPSRRRAAVDDSCVQAKTQDLAQRITAAVESQDVKRMDLLWDKIRDMRRAGLELTGEFGCENLAFKLLRNSGDIERLDTARKNMHDQELSLAEKAQEPVRYGYGSMNEEGSNPSGVSASTKMFVSETPESAVLERFIDWAAKRLDITKLPQIHLHQDTAWSESNHSFGRYDPETHELHVSLPNRHVLDVLRTTAHELAHCRQHELGNLPDDAGKTGSDWENEAHAVAGIIMRDFADANPSYFDSDQPTVSEGLDQLPRLTRNAIAAACMAAGISGCATVGDTLNTTRDVARLATQIQRTGRAGMQEELAQELKNYARARGGDATAQNQSILYRKERELRESSGYIPTEAERDDPRFVMALTQDVQPGETGRQANKLHLETDAQGRPALLRESQQLDEIRMNPASLRRAAAQTGALVGMEFEMCVPDVVGGEEDLPQEPDYSQDETPESIQQIFDFFYDSEYNTRSQVERLRDRLEEDYQEARNEAMMDDFNDQAESLIEDVIRNDVSEEGIIDAWLQKKYSGSELQDILNSVTDAPTFDSSQEQQQYADAHPEYQIYLSARDNVDEIIQLEAERSARDQDQHWQQAWSDFQNDWDGLSEEEWLSQAGINNMQDVEERYNINWPYWTSAEDEGTDPESIAASFGNYVGRRAVYTDQYHGGRQTTGYVVEPDSSINCDPGDRGLEFVSPPLTIDDMIADLDSVVTWARKMGCYTNRSTGLHINVSVPNFDVAQLDYVKLALLLGDEHVLEQFGRLSNSYTRSAMEKIRKRISTTRSAKPNDISGYFDMLRQGMARLASQYIHSPETEKYTSINVRENRIEFRSPGGNWLDMDLDLIKNTLLRFVVALDAAVDPNKYREEYLKKLYLILAPKSNQDLMALFAQYSAGALPKAALKSFVRQAQYVRQQAQSPESTPTNSTIMEPLWWVRRSGTSEEARVRAPNSGQAIMRAVRQNQPWYDAYLIGDFDPMAELTAFPMTDLDIN